MFSYLQIAAIILTITLIKWDTNNCQIVTKYGGITLIGFITGLIMGDMHTGLIIGGTMELMQVGLYGASGSSVPDYQIGACIGTAFAITSGQGLNIALTIGMPVAALSVNFDILAKTFGCALLHIVQRQIGRGNYHTAYKIIGASSFSRGIFTGTLPAIIYLFLGSLFVNNILSLAPSWILDGMKIAGNILPALGICLLIKHIPVKNVLYILAGYILSAIFHMPILVVAIIGIVLAYHSYKKHASHPTKPVTLSPDNSTAMPTLVSTSSGTDRLITGHTENISPTPHTVSKDSSAYRVTDKDLKNVFFRYLCTVQAAFNYETHISCGVVFALGPVLQKIYADNTKLCRHSLMEQFHFFNSQSYLGAALLAASLAMEEKEHSVVGIYSASLLRTSLMGPFTSIGDTLFNNMLTIVTAGISAHYAMDGNILGMCLCLLFSFFLLIIRWKLFQIGYSKGVLFITEGKEKLDTFTNSLMLLGSIVIGSLIAINVQLPDILSFLPSGWVHDGLSDILCIGTVGSVYLLLTNKSFPISAAKMVWLIIALCLLGAYIG